MLFEVLLSERNVDTLEERLELIGSELIDESCLVQTKEEVFHLKFHGWMKGFTIFGNEIGDRFRWGITCLAQIGTCSERDDEVLALVKFDLKLVVGFLRIASRGHDRVVILLSVSLHHNYIHWNVGPSCLTGDPSSLLLMSANDELLLDILDKDTVEVLRAVDIGWVLLDVVREGALVSLLYPLSYLAYIDTIEVLNEVIIAHPESAIFPEDWLDLINHLLSPAGLVFVTPGTLPFKATPRVSHVKKLNSFVFLDMND